MDYVTSETENTVARNPLDVIKIGLLEKEVADLRGIIERLEERIEGPAAESQEKKPGKVVRIFSWVTFDFLEGHRNDEIKAFRAKYILANDEEKQLKNAKTILELEFQRISAISSKFSAFACIFGAIIGAIIGDLFYITQVFM